MTRDWTIGRLLRLTFALLLWLFVAQAGADADLWGHVRFGLDALATHAIPVADPYSFTSDRIWINHEWLSEVVMALAYAGGGALGLNLLRLSIVGLLAALVGWTLQWEPPASGGGRGIVVGLTILAVSTRLLTIRPQIFALGLFAVVLYAMRTVDRGRDRALWAIPVCLALWANLHGSWIIGLAVVLTWLAGQVWVEGAGRRRSILIGAGGLAIAATLANPYGIGLWRFLLETVRFARPDIAEWRPLLALPPVVLAVEAILPLLAVAGWARTRRRVSFGYLVVVLMLWAAAFKTGRIDAFAQLATAMLLGPELIAGIATLGGAFRSPLWRRRLPLGAAPAFAVAVLIAVGAWRLRELPVPASWAPDRQAAAFLRTSAPGSKVLTWFDWGEYAIWELAPSGVRVSMDGRRETVYGAEVLSQHRAFYHADTGAIDYPDRIGADYVWVPVDLPVVGVLRSHGWHPLFESAQSIVLARDGAAARAAAGAAATGPAFLWP